MPYILIILIAFLSLYISAYVLFIKQKKPAHLIGLLISNILIFLIFIIEIIIFGMGLGATCPSPCKIEIGRLMEIYILVIPLVLASLASLVGSFMYFRKESSQKKKMKQTNIIAGAFIIFIISSLNFILQSVLLLNLISITE